MLALRRTVAGGAMLIALLAACSTDKPSPARDSAAPSESAASSNSAPVANVTCEEPPTPGAPLTFTELPSADTAKGITKGTISTSCGDIGVELYADKAPQAVASFAFLAQNKYWDNSACHRLVVDGIYVLQCGDPTGTGRGGPGYTFGVENDPDDEMYPAGTLAMARAQSPDSNGGQFFITYQDSMIPKDEEGVGYTIFGRVTSGMDILKFVADAGVTGGGQQGNPAQPISILSVHVTK